MDRYDLREITVVITPADETFGLHTNVVVAKSGNGEWVKYSDAIRQIEVLEAKYGVALDGKFKALSDDIILAEQVEATERRLIEVEEMAAWYQQQHQQLVAEREAAQARVRELELKDEDCLSVLASSVDDEYVIVHMKKEVWSRIRQSTKGTI